MSPVRARVCEKRVKREDMLLGVIERSLRQLERHHPDVQQSASAVPQAATGTGASTCMSAATWSGILLR